MIWGPQSALEPYCRGTCFWTPFKPIILGPKNNFLKLGYSTSIKHRFYPLIYCAHGGLQIDIFFASFFLIFWYHHHHLDHVKIDFSFFLISVLGTYELLFNSVQVPLKIDIVFPLVTYFIVLSRTSSHPLLSKYRSRKHNSPFFRLFSLFSQFVLIFLSQVLHLSVNLLV